MSYLIAINAKDWEIKDKDKCQKSRTKYANPKLGPPSSGHEPFAVETVEDGAPRRIEPLIRLHRPISPKAYPISHTALTVPAPSLYVCARRCTFRVAYSPPHARHPAL